MEIRKPVPFGAGPFLFGSGGAFAGKRAFICRAISVGRLATGGIRSECLRPAVLWLDIGERADGSINPVVV